MTIEFRRELVMNELMNMGFDEDTAQVLFLIHLECTDPGALKDPKKCQEVLIDDMDLDEDVHEIAVVSEAYTDWAMDVFEILITDSRIGEEE